METIFDKPLDKEVASLNGHNSVVIQKSVIHL